MSPSLRAVRIDTGRAVFAGRLPVAPWLLNPILLFCDVVGLLDRPVFILDFFRLKEPFIELAIVLLHWVKGRSAGRGKRRVAMSPDKKAAEPEKARGRAHAHTQITRRPNYTCMGGVTERHHA